MAAKSKEDLRLPGDPKLEEMVLGAIMLGGIEQFDKAAALISETDFLLQKHKLVWITMAALREREDPIDRVTLASELHAHKRLELVDGLSWLTSLDEGLPEITHIESYARKVKLDAARRELMFAAQNLLAKAQNESIPIEDLVSGATDAIAAVQIGQGKGDDGRTPLQVVEQYKGGISAFLDPTLRAKGLPTGFTKLDETTNGMHAGEMIIIGARPGAGKTSFLLNIAEHLCLDSEPRTMALFSLEMTADSLMTRLMCSRAMVDSHKFRAGYLNASERNALRIALNDLIESRLILFDKFGITIAEIAKHVKKMVKDEGLQIVGIDYIGLVGSRSKSENRNLELSAMTRELKMLAGECQIPIIVLSQLNRANEKRPGSKKPILSDLRECVSADSKLLDAMSGALVPISEICPGFITFGMNNQQKIIRTTVSEVWSTGRQTVFEVRLRTGKIITTTANHPFFTADGWRKLSDLAAGSVIATPMRMPEIGASPSVQDIDKCRLMGYFIGNGGYSGYATPSFTTPDRETMDDCIAIIHRLWPMVTPKDKPHHKCKTIIQTDFSRLYENGYGKPGGNELREWLRSINSLGQKAGTKVVPPFIFLSGVTGIREFIAGYLLTDGCIKKVGKRWSIQFDTVSYQLAVTVQHFLLRLGVISSVGKPTLNTLSKQPIYRIGVSQCAKNMLLLASQLRLVGYKKEKMDELVRDSEGIGETGGGLFNLPNLVSVKASRLDCGWRDQGKQMRRSMATKISDLSGDDTLAMFATSDLLWESIDSIESIGDMETFDLRAPETGSFIANDVVVHNSGALEQDSDGVWFLHRPELYEGGKDREDVKGKVELLVSKNRHGPTGQIDLRFLSNFTKFANNSNDSAPSGDTPREEDSW